MTALLGDCARMGAIKRVARNYWISYYLVYIGGVAFGLWRYWEQLDEAGVYLLAAIFGASAGGALLVAIVLEVTGRMVLLIPAAIKKYKEEGRQEERRRIRHRLIELRRSEAPEGDREPVMLTLEDFITLLEDIDSRP